MIAQTEDPSIAIEKQKEQRERREERKKRALLEEQRRQQQEAEQKTKRKLASKLLAKRCRVYLVKNTNANRGTTEGSGTQGVSTGNANQGQTSGTGGIGTRFRWPQCGQWRFDTTKIYS